MARRESKQRRTRSKPRSRLRGIGRRWQPLVRTARAQSIGVSGRRPLKVTPASALRESHQSCRRAAPRVHVVASGRRHPAPKYSKA